jgi:drug/metabolite transporter (DMT)-like permease
MVDRSPEQSIMVDMQAHDRKAILGLAAAGALWGLTVPLSKLSLGWLTPAWLTVARFAAAAPLVGVAGRRGLREALTPRIAASGAVGFGLVIVLQNAGIARTSVTHAALLVGAVPVLVALMAAARGDGTGRASHWIGYALTLAGVGLIARSSGGGAHSAGDLLVLASVVLSATFIVLQPGLLGGRDAAAVTAVQFAAGALVALPLAVLTESLPARPAQVEPVLALAALSAAGTLLPFWLFAVGQARVPADVAAAFVNLEPVVGAVAGWLAFGDAATLVQLGGALAVLAGIALSTSTAPTRSRPPIVRPQPDRAPAKEAEAAQPGSGWDNSRRCRALIGTPERSHKDGGIRTSPRSVTRRARGDHAIRRAARNRASGGEPR